MQIDPAKIAEAKALEGTSFERQHLAKDQQAAKTKAEGLSQLRSSLQEFRTSMSPFTTKKTLVAMTATLNHENAGSVSVTRQAQAGTYQLFVDQLATQHQVVFQNGDAFKREEKFTLKLNNGESFEIKLDALDSADTPAVTVEKVARAINAAPENKARVAASLLTVGDQRQLILTAKATGKAQGIAALTGESGNDVLAQSKVLVAAQDAVVYLGAREDSGIKIEQGSNTLTCIEGVSLTLKRTLQQNEAPLQLSVSKNEADSVANVQSFIDSYSKMSKALDSMTAAAQPLKKLPGGAFASDSVVRGLRSKFSDILHQQFDGVRLLDMGITFSRDGALQLNRKRYDAFIEANPNAVNTVFFGTDSKVGGLLKKLNDCLDPWLNNTNGVLKQRSETQQRFEKELNTRQEKLEKKYETLYKKYHQEFSSMQATQAKMKETMDFLKNHISV